MRLKDKKSYILSQIISIKIEKSLDNQDLIGYIISEFNIDNKLTIREEDNMPRKINTVSEATIKRLPSYYHYLNEVYGDNENVSAAQIGKALNLKSIQVRKDIAATGIIGKPKTGYNREELKQSIKDFLGWSRKEEAVLIGCGHLGAALLGYHGFKKYGFEIVMAFDSDENKVGTEIHGKEVFPVEKLTSIPKYCSLMKVYIGIIAVPAEHAQKAADMLIQSGIKAIWNFAPAALDVPENIIVQQQDMTDSLALLSKKLEAAMDK